jgi:hypothetical protein
MKEPAKYLAGLLLGSTLTFGAGALAEDAAALGLVFYQKAGGSA